jgi:hypothetical protein
MKPCRLCKIEKPLSEYHKSGQRYADGHRSDCKACVSLRPRQVRTEYNKRKWLEHQAFVNTLKDVPCYDCGNRFPTVCMDFDHRDPSQKVFQISDASLVHRVKVLAEIAKCDVVCANCHRIRTHG